MNHKRWLGSNDELRVERGQLWCNQNFLKFSNRSCVFAAEIFWLQLTKIVRIDPISGVRRRWPIKSLNQRFPGCAAIKRFFACTCMPPGLFYTFSRNGPCGLCLLYSKMKDKSRLRSGNPTRNISPTPQLHQNWRYIHSLSFSCSSSERLAPSISE